MLAPRTTGDSSHIATTSSNPRAPKLAHTARGVFPTTALTDEDRARALDELEKDTVVASTARVRQSNWRTWLAFHLRWFGASMPPLPLTPQGIRAVAAQMKEAHYRSFPGYLSAAREFHRADGHAWSDELELCRKRSVASTQRGIGPARQSIEVPPQRVFDMQLDSTALHDHGPINPTHWAVLCSFHMLRGAESACALASSLTISEDERREALSLPGSKTDPQGVGHVRSWGCVCAGNLRVACPYHSALAIKAELSRRFGDNQSRLPPGLPLFPTATGEWCSRDGFITTISHFADSLGLDTVDQMGRGTIGEHVWRISGSRMLAHARVPIPTIALMARWGSNVIMRYVELAPLSTITDTYAQAVASSSTDPAPQVRSVVSAAVHHTLLDASTDGIADDCFEPALPPPTGPRYALNSTTGVLHVIARRVNWGRTIPGRTNCGRDFLSHEYAPVCSLTATYVRNGMALPNTKCNGCAKPAAWADMESLLDDASSSE